MSELSLFQFDDQEIRFAGDLPIANDVAAALGYADPSKTVSTKVDKDYKGVTDLVTPGGVQTLYRGTRL